MKGTSECGAAECVCSQDGLTEELRQNVLGNELVDRITKRQDFHPPPKPERPMHLLHHRTETPGDNEDRSARHHT